LNVSVPNGERLSREQIQAFLGATDEVRFEGANWAKVYSWFSRTLSEQECWKRGKEVKGLLLDDLASECLSGFPGLSNESLADSESLYM
jgi:hypothetical protein